MNGKLNVGAPCFHTNFPDDRNGGIPHDLVFLVRQRLSRGHGNAVTRVHTHGVKIFNGTDDDHIVLKIPHDLQFIFLPPDERLLDNNLIDHAGLKTGLCDFFHLLPVVGHTTAGPTQGKTGPKNQRVADPLGHSPCLIHIPDDPVFRHMESDVVHGIPEQFPVLGFLNNRY